MVIESSSSFFPEVVRKSARSASHDDTHVTTFPTVLLCCAVHSECSTPVTKTLLHCKALYKRAVILIMLHIVTLMWFRKKKKIKKSHYRQLPLGFSQVETPQQHWSHYWGRITVWAERERNAKYEVVKCWLQSSHIVGRLLLLLKFIYISEVKLMLLSTAVYFKVSTWILNWHFFKLPVTQGICVKTHNH